LNAWLTPRTIMTPEVIAERERLYCAVADDL
jgi:hypothetical protein